MNCQCCSGSLSGAKANEETSAEQKSSFTVHTSFLFDPFTKSFEKDISLIVDPASGLITQLYKRSEPLAGLNPSDIDLRDKFVISGLVDAHTHIFLHAYTERSATEQMRDESYAERILRASNHCRRLLLAGYTTYRDLGSELMQDADANVRDAINRGVIPGPRLYVATELLLSTLSYELRTENAMGGLKLPRASEPCDGVDSIRKLVRKRVAAGADIIKFYADYRKKMMRFPPLVQHPYKGSVRFPPLDPNPSVVLFAQEEMNAIVEEATRNKCIVAAHCGENESVQMALRAGVLTIEHGYSVDEETLQIIKEHGCIFVPTLAVCEQLQPLNLPRILKSVKKAHEMGITIACGGDTGAFSHGDNIRELELMVEAGIPVCDVLVSLTYRGWQSCGSELIGRNFGWLGVMCAADLIAVDSSPVDDFGVMRDVKFVMKDGEVYKKDGIPNYEKFM